MNTAEKQELFFTWLETPREERKPKFRSWLAKELGVNPATLNEWEDNRRKIDLEKSILEIGKLPTSYDELVKIAISSDNQKKAELARAKMWVIGMEGKGNWKSLTDFLKSIGDFVEKREDTIKYELTTEDRDQIAERAAKILRGFSERGSGENSLPTEPPLLPQ